MGFTAYLAIVCAIAVILDIVLFVYKKKTLGIIILCLLIVGLSVLGYLWFISPM